MNPIAKKLRIKEADVLLTVNAPPGFRSTLGTLPARAKIVTESGSYSQVHWFVPSKAQMEEEA